MAKEEEYGLHLKSYHSGCLITFFFSSYFFFSPFEQGFSYTYVITEPPGPPKRMFHDEVIDPLEKKRLVQSLSDAQRAFQQAAYELYVTEADYVRDIKIMIDVSSNSNCSLIFF